jgi:hypothetical protein
MVLRLKGSPGRGEVSLGHSHLICNDHLTSPASTRRQICDIAAHSDQSLCRRVIGNRELEA